MRRLIPTCALLLGLCFAGCAPGLDSEAARQVRSADDPFKPYEEHASATVRTGIHPNILQLTLIAHRDRTTRAVATLAKVQIAYMSHSSRHYESVRNERAEALAFRRLNHDRRTCTKAGGCVHLEELLIDIPENQLRAAAQTGYRFKIFARAGGEHLVTVPGVLIVSLLESLDKGRSAPAAQPAQKKAGLAAGAAHACGAQT